MNCWYPR